MNRCRHVQLIAAEPGWRVVDPNGHHFQIVAWFLCETGCEVDVDHGPGVTTRSFNFDPVSEECGLDERWQVRLAERKRVIHAIVVASGPDAVYVGALHLEGGYLIASVGNPPMCTYPVHVPRARPPAVVIGRRPPWRRLRVAVGAALRHPLVLLGLGSALQRLLGS